MKDEKTTTHHHHHHHHHHHSHSARNKRVQYSTYITHTACIAAIYAALTIVMSLLGLDKGTIQLRISEALCILPVLMPAAVPGLFIGCFLSSLLTGAVIWDTVFGSIATLIGALGAALVRKLPDKLMFIATIPTILANAAIIPFVLMYGYGIEGTYMVLMWPILVSEFICAGVLGTVIYYPTKSLLIKIENRR